MNQIVFGFIAHLLGDYVFQSHHIAVNKTKEWFDCLIHVAIHCGLFYCIVGVSWALAVIVVSHYFIDRYRLATYWIAWLNNSNPKENNGYPKDCPSWLSTILMIIVDNTFHITINTACIYFYYA